MPSPFVTLRGGERGRGGRCPGAAVRRQSRCQTECKPGAVFHRGTPGVATASGNEPGSGLEGTGDAGTGNRTGRAWFPRHGLEERGW